MMLFIKVALAILMVNLKAIDAMDPESERDIKVDDKIIFEIFTKATKKNQDKPYILKFRDDDSLKRSPLIQNEKTVIFFPDVGETGREPDTQMLFNNLLQVRNWNIILVKWGELANTKDRATLETAKVVGRDAAKVFKWLESKEAISRSKIHAIGIGYGTNAIAFMSRALEEPKIARITGLGVLKHIDTKYEDFLYPTDAKFVDIIHADNVTLNAQPEFGHMEFYQDASVIWASGPERPVLKGPSTRTAVKLYAETIIEPTKYPAIPCPYNECEKCPKTYMGFGANSKAYKIMYHVSEYLTVAEHCEIPYGIDENDTI